MLVREGQIIGREEMLKLKYQFKNSPDNPWFIVLLATFTFSMVSIGIVLHVVEKSLPYLRLEMRDYLFLGILLILLLIVSRLGIWFGDNIGDSSRMISTSSFIYAVPLSAGAMIACIFFGVTVSIFFSLVVTLFSGIIFGKEFAMFFYFMIGAFVAAHSVSQCKNRMVPIKAGLLVGGANVVLIVSVHIFRWPVGIFEGPWQLVFRAVRRGIRGNSGYGSDPSCRDDVRLHYGHQAARACHDGPASSAGTHG